MSRPIVLYIEDDPNDVFFLELAFRRAGVDVVLQPAEDAEGAFGHLRLSRPASTAETLPSLILLDVNLPVRSGFEVLQWLRGGADFKEVPVVMFSSSGRAEDRGRAQALGATDYLLKPTSLSGFIEVVRHFVERGWLG